jgi:hypothetical protein
LFHITNITKIASKAIIEEKARKPAEFLSFFAYYYLKRELVFIKLILDCCCSVHRHAKLNQSKLLAKAIKSFYFLDNTRTTILFFIAKA